MNNRLFNMAKAEERQRAIDAGFYDGRYRARVIPDKRNKRPKHKKPNNEHYEQ